MPAVRREPSDKCDPRDPRDPRDRPEPPQRFSHWPALPPPVSVPLAVLPEHACAYRPGRTAQNRALLARGMPGELYHRFMDAGFRRSGRLIYQPICAGCRACVPIRVPVASFAPSKSQRRTWRRNADLSIAIDPPAFDTEAFDLYRRYVSGWHGGEQGSGPEDYRSFLIDSPVETLLFRYRDPSGRLLAVGVCDVCESSLSSVYFFFDPTDARRGLGTYGALCEIDYARRTGIPCYYLGYWVERCATMDYKSAYRPHQLLGSDGVWRMRTTSPAERLP